MRTELSGHTSFETAYLVEDYPYGRLRCKIWFWVEANKKGFRFCSRTENPKTGRLNAPKCGQYYKVAGAMYLDDVGHVKFSGLSEYSKPAEYQAFFLSFPLADKRRASLLARERSDMYYRVVKSGKKMFSINGVREDLTSAEKEDMTADMMAWQDVAQIGG